jgi:hypothetical protein
MYSDMSQQTQNTIDQNKIQKFMNRAVADIVHCNGNVKSSLQFLCFFIRIISRQLNIEWNYKYCRGINATLL